MTTEAEIVSILSDWSRCESPSNDAARVNAMHDLVSQEIESSPAIRIQRIAGTAGVGDIVLLQAGPESDRTGLLLLAHVDTVHPVGTIDSALPVRREGDRLYGPGLYDMKGGVFCAVRALRNVAAAGLSRPVTMLLSPDEEIGSPTTADRIRRLAETADIALVVEPARPGGHAVTARKGVAWFEITTVGRPAHAGTHHADGRSAIRAACDLVRKLEGLTDYELGTTVCVGEIRGGTARNVVPARCSFTVDVRVSKASEVERIQRTVSALDCGPDIAVTIGGGFNRPPFEKTPESAALLANAAAIAAGIGFSLTDVPMVGGGSDGNFVATAGVPTLDGLGVEGGGAHTNEEFMLVSSVTPRIELLTCLLFDRSIGR